MNLQTTKSQTIALMAQELNAIEKQCESYQLAVSRLHKQVVVLTEQVRKMDQRSLAREERLLNQLNGLQDTLRLLQ